MFQQQMGFGTGPELYGFQASQAGQQYGQLAEQRRRAEAAQRGQQGRPQQMRPSFGAAPGQTQPQPQADDGYMTPERRSHLSAIERANAEMGERLRAGPRPLTPDQQASRGVGEAIFAASGLRGRPMSPEVPTFDDAGQQIGGMPIPQPQQQPAMPPPQFFPIAGGLMPGAMPPAVGGLSRKELLHQSAFQQQPNQVPQQGQVPPQPQQNQIPQQQGGNMSLVQALQGGPAGLPGYVRFNQPQGNPNGWQVSSVSQGDFTATGPGLAGMNPNIVMNDLERANNAQAAGVPFQMAAPTNQDLVQRAFQDSLGFGQAAANQFLPTARQGIIADQQRDFRNTLASQGQANQAAWQQGQLGIQQQQLGLDAEKLRYLQSGAGRLQDLLRSGVPIENIPSAMNLFDDWNDRHNQQGDGSATQPNQGGSQQPPQNMLGVQRDIDRQRAEATALFGQDIAGQMFGDLSKDTTIADLATKVYQRAQTDPNWGASAIPKFEEMLNARAPGALQRFFTRSLPGQIQKGMKNAWNTIMGLPENPQFGAEEMFRYRSQFPRGK